jgi:hypothetical protein
MNSLMHKVISTGMVVAAAGCASSPPPTLQTGPEAEVTVDGLVRVDNPVVAVAYRKPDLDLTPYTRFMLDPVEVAYQKDPGNVRRSGYAGAGNNFALSTSQMESFRGRFQEAVVEALTEDDGYELTTEPAVYTRSYGLVTLVLDLHDSQSGEILARAADRRDPTRDTSSSLASVNTAMVRSDVNRLFRHWADLLRERLDAFREM